MAQSLTQLFVHLVFSTKERRKMLGPAIREELEAYIVGLLENRECQPVIVKAVDDHVHMLFLLSKNLAFSKAVGEIKAVSSKWIKSKGRDWRTFEWQGGYGAFSVSSSNVARVKAYIAGQEEHHRKRSFEEELRLLLQKHNVQYDERYLLS
jgi:putative transposase